MNRITLTLSTEVIEAIDALAARLNATRAEIISFYLEGSTNLRKVRIPRKFFFAQRFNQPAPTLRRRNAHT